MTTDSIFPSYLTVRAAALLDRCRAAALKIATAESCTGGLVAGLLTEIPGSSAVVERGFVVYSNEAKQDLLEIQAAALTRRRTVSRLERVGSQSAARTPAKLAPRPPPEGPCFPRASL